MTRDKDKLVLIKEMMKIMIQLKINKMKLFKRFKNIEKRCILMKFQKHHQVKEMVSKIYTIK